MRTLLGRGQHSPTTATRPPPVADRRHVATWSHRKPATRPTGCRRRLMPHDHRPSPTTGHTATNWPRPMHCKHRLSPSTAARTPAVADQRRAATYQALWTTAARPSAIADRHHPAWATAGHGHPATGCRRPAPPAHPVADQRHPLIPAPPGHQLSPTNPTRSSTVADQRHPVINCHRPAPPGHPVADQRHPAINCRRPTRLLIHLYMCVRCDFSIATAMGPLAPIVRCAMGRVMGRPRRAPVPGA